MPRHIYRNAIDGRIVTQEYAEANPHTTVRETVEDDEPRWAPPKVTPLAVSPVAAPGGPQVGETWVTRDGCKATILHRFQVEHRRPRNMVILALLNPGDIYEEEVFFTGVEGRVSSTDVHDWDLIAPEG